MLLRGIDADELDVGRRLELVEQAGAERRASGRFLAGEPLAQVHVVHDLVAIVVLLGLLRVVVADRRADRNPIQHVAIRLEVGEEPVVVFVARVPGPQQEALLRVDVVAGGDDEPRVVQIDRVHERLRDFRWRFVPGDGLRMPTPKSPMTMNENGPASGACGSGSVRNSFL